MSTEGHISTTIKMLSELQKAATTAKNGKVTIEVNNVAGRPFKVISKPGGAASWGVGGSSGAVTPVRGDIKIVK